METILTKQNKNIFRNQNGAVAIMFVGFLNVMVGMLALAINSGVAFKYQSMSLSAATAAAISGAITGGDLAAVRKYFKANLPNGQSGISYDYDQNVKVKVDGNSVDVMPEGIESPSFFPVNPMAASAGKKMPGLEVGSVSSVGMTSQQMKPADYFFVLDTSGSMETVGVGCCDSISPITGQPTSRLKSVKEATTRVINSIASGTNAQSNYGVDIISWSSALNVSSPLTNDFARQSSVVQRLYANGSTCGECGLNEVAKHTPLSAAGRTKVVIFMTDGSMNECQGSNNHCGCNCYPVPPLNPKYLACLADCASPRAIPKAKAACDKVKEDKEVTIWAITFGNDIANDPASAKLRDDCASDPSQSVHVANGKELDKLFGEIFNKTGRLRVNR